MAYAGEGRPFGSELVNVCQGVAIDELLSVRDEPQGYLVWRPGRRGESRLRSLGGSRTEPKPGTGKETARMSRGVVR